MGSHISRKIGIQPRRKCCLDTIPCSGMELGIREGTRSSGIANSGAELRVAKEARLSGISNAEIKLGRRKEYGISPKIA